MDVYIAMVVWWGFQDGCVHTVAMVVCWGFQDGCVHSYGCVLGVSRWMCT